MKNKKGFTLVEVLAVIAILGIIMIIVTPNVLNPFKKSKRKIFLENVESVRSSATTTYLINPNIGTTFCKGQNGNGTLLNISADNISYRVSVDNDGNVISILVTNGELTYSDSGSIIKKKDIKDDEIKLTEVNTNINC